MTEASYSTAELHSRRRLLKRIAAAAGAGGLLASAAALLHRAAPLAGVFAAKPSPAQSPLSFAAARSESAADCAIAHGQNAESMVRAAMKALGGIETFIRKGDRVLIKVNAAFDRPASFGATTAPDMLRAFILLCAEAGAAEIRIADNPINRPEACFLKTGLRAEVENLAARIPVRIMPPEARHFARIAIGGRAIGEWEAFAGALAGIDKAIGLAPLKDHNLAGASMAMKNWYGLLGGPRNLLHQNIHQTVADLAEWIRPTFVALDARRILVRNGPTGGGLADLAPGDALLVGADQVAIDARAAETLLRRDLDSIEYIREASRRGLGQADWRQARWAEAQE